MYVRHASVEYDMSYELRVMSYELIPIVHLKLERPDGY